MQNPAYVLGFIYEARVKFLKKLVLIEEENISYNNSFNSMSKWFSGLHIKN